MGKIKTELLEEVLWGTHKLYEYGLSPIADSGDVSIRDPETGYVYITGGPEGRDLEIFNLSDCRLNEMAVIDMDGNRVLDYENYPTMEYPMHLAIYRARPDVNAIVHSHAQWSGIYAIMGKPVPHVLVEQSVKLGGDIRCTEEMVAGTDTLGLDVVKALEGRNAAIMRHHGAVAVGADIKKAFQCSIYLECAAKKSVFASLLGGLEEINSIEEVLDKKYIV